MDPLEKKKILQELGDISEGVYDDLTRLFIAQLRERIPQLKTALLNRDFDTVAKLAHSLKGSSGNLRIYKIYGLSSDINDMAKKKELESKIEEKIRLLEESVPALENEFGQMKP